MSSRYPGSLRPAVPVLVPGTRYAFSTNCCFIFASCVRMLPSYTVLPMRATTPPMSAGSTASSSCTFLPVASAETLLERAHLVRGQRRGGRHDCAHDVAVRQQTLAIDLEQLGQQLEPAALGEHRQQLGHRRLHRPCRSATSRCRRAPSAACAGSSAPAATRHASSPHPRHAVRSRSMRAGSDSWIATSSSAFA